jgi:hypothetical protein
MVLFIRLHSGGEMGHGGSYFGRDADHEACKVDDGLVVIDGINYKWI